jgi:hypothetical protein
MLYTKTSFSPFAFSPVCVSLTYRKEIGVCFCVHRQLLTIDIPFKFWVPRSSLTTQFFPSFDASNVQSSMSHLSIQSERVLKRVRMASLRKALPTETHRKECIWQTKIFVAANIFWENRVICLEQNNYWIVSLTVPEEAWRSARISASPVRSNLCYQRRLTYIWSTVIQHRPFLNPDRVLIFLSKVNGSPSKMCMSFRGKSGVSIFLTTSICWISDNPGQLNNGLTSLVKADTMPNDWPFWLLQ